MPPTRKLFAAPVVAALLLVACGDDEETTETGADTEEPAAGDAGGEPGASGIAVDGGFGDDPTITVPDGFEAPTELVAEDLVVGDGDEVPAGASVTVHYEGVLLDGTVFDGSFESEPVTFSLSGVIEGWTEGIPGMRVGGRRLLVIPPELAYGASGHGPIGPNETLVFVVDMVAVG